MKAMIKRFMREEDDATGVGYALLLAFAALAMVASDPTVKAAVGNIWSIIATQLSVAATWVVLVCPGQVQRARAWSGRIDPGQQHQRRRTGRKQDSAPGGPVP